MNEKGHFVRTVQLAELSTVAGWEAAGDSRADGATVLMRRHLGPSLQVWVLPSAAHRACRFPSAPNSEVRSTLVA
jgi:hypothetical protein